MSRVNSGEIKKINSGSELKISEEKEEEEAGEGTPFKDKVLGTSKLQEENKAPGGGVTSPRKPEFLRMQSQIALPVVKNE